EPRWASRRVRSRRPRVRGVFRGQWPLLQRNRLGRGQTRGAGLLRLRPAKTMIYLFLFLLALAGSNDDAQDSPAKQITRANVSKLELAWTFPVPGTSGRFGFRPLVVDGTMYVLGPNNALVALDADTGKTAWTHPVEGRPTDRGINYWQSKDGS